MSSPLTRTLSARDGTRLHVERQPPHGAPRGVLVMVHGFAMHSGPYRSVAAAFAGAGLDVTSFDCRGHGRSEGRRGYVARFSEYLDDLQSVLAAAAAESPALPAAVLGHSQGATIALAYALEERSPLAALVLAAPWLALKMKVPAVKRAAAALLGRVWPTLALPNGIRAADAAREPAVQAQLTGDPLIHHLATSRWFNEARALQATLPVRAAGLRVPTLMAIAGADRIADAQAALDFARAAGPIVDVKIYEPAFHEILLDPDAPEIVADLVSWLVPRLEARIIGAS
jgi:alpha-beta hydrolase superfamily lysophospholipase